MGKHGIIIEFEIKGEGYNATYLPEVAHEQGWDQLTTLKHLVKKAGYSGPIDKILPEIELTTYESGKCKMRFDEWPGSKDFKL